MSALLVMLIMAALGTTAITLTTFDSEITSNYLSAVQSRSAAEAGIKHMMTLYRADPTTFTGTQSASAMGLPTAKPGAVNLPPNFVYWISNLTYEGSVPPQYVDITGSGSVINTPSLSRVTVRLAYTPPSPFDYGLFADEGITMGGGGYIDSYNACDAAYDPLNPGNSGDIGTNATGEGAIALDGGAEVRGDATVGMGGDPTTDISGGTITGSQTALLASKELLPKHDPGGGVNETLVLESDETKTLTSGTYRLAHLDIGGQGIGTIDGDVTLYIDDYLLIEGQGQLVVPLGSSLTIYVNGSFDIGGGGLINQTGLPNNLMIYGTPTSTVGQVRGNSDFYGAIYAPNADIVTTGTSDYYGALIGKTLDIDGNIHFDECLKPDVGGDDPFRVVFWRKD